MAWSTREIAELAGTSLRTVRHYHEVGLLAEPERRANGYKRYGVEHLVRLLRIKRLTELGFSLPQIAEMGDADEHPEQALRLLDAEIASTIERLQRVRAELALILSKSAPTDLPPELATVNANSNLSDADRKFTVVMSRLLSPSAIDAYKDMISGYAADTTGREFDALPPDADEQTCADLAERMLPMVRELQGNHPGMTELKAKSAQDKKFAAHTVNSALYDLYNPAQLNVMRHLNKMIVAAATSEPD